MHQSITVQVSPGVYERIRRAAEQRHRSIDELLSEAIERRRAGAR